MSCRAWAARQRAVRLVTGHPNSAGGTVIPPDPTVMIVKERPIVAPACAAQTSS